jgi:hypothetical protein
MTAPFWYMLRMNPISATKTSLEYQVFRHKTATDEDFNEGFDFFKQVEIEDKELCDAAQKNLNVGTYSAGKLEPHQEVGVLYAQNLIREAVMTHRKKEVEAGREIWAARINTAVDSVENGDELFCQELERCSGGSKAMDW